MLVRSIDLEDQLVEVLGRLRFDVQPDLEHSRCSRCNGVLIDQAKEDIAADVPPYVLDHATRFKRCQRCRVVVWPGTHTTKILARMQRVVDRLD